MLVDLALSVNIASIVSSASTRRKISSRAAYDASFAKLISFVAHRDSRHTENPRTLRDLFQWLARSVVFLLNSVQHH